MSKEKELNKKLDELSESEKKVKQFSELLESIKELDNKKRILWKEIYDNAISDREKASILFTEGFKNMNGGTSDHISVGPTLVKYLERMCKSNAQIISLADMINKSEEMNSKIDPDDLFSKIVE